MIKKTKNQTEQKNGSSVDIAIELLNASRKDTNVRLAKDNLKLTRTSDSVVVLENTETKEKQLFEIEIVENMEHPRFDDAYKLLDDTFDLNELDPKDIMVAQMQGLRYGQTIETGAKAVIFTLSKVIEFTNESGEKVTRKEVVGVFDGGLINLQDETGKFTDESVLMGFYIVSKTDEDPKRDYRKYGFGREIIISAYLYSEKEAKRRGKKFIGFAGECTYTSRAFWEKLGWKRCYIKPKNDKSKNWKEISYVQPPLDFDLDTGKIAEGAGDAPEHFTADMFGNDQEMDASKLVGIVNGFYRTNNFISPRAFNLIRNDSTGELSSSEPNIAPSILQERIEAYKRHHEAVDKHLRDFKDQFEGMEIRFLSEDEIEKEELRVKNYYPGGNEERAMVARKNTDSLEKREIDNNF